MKMEKRFEYFGMYDVEHRHNVPTGKKEYVTDKTICGLPVIRMGREQKDANLQRCAMCLQ